MRAQTVSNWVMRKSIPVRHWPKLIEIGMTSQELVDAHLDSEEEKTAAA